MTQATPLHRTRLVAHTRHLDDDVDILDTVRERDFVWWHHGQGFVANGVARRVSAGLVQECLSAIDATGDDEVSGAGPIAVGALPFDGAADAEMVVPARLWRRDAQGRTWVTDISDGAGGGPHPWFERRPVPAHFAVPGDMSSGDWAHAVGAALAKIDAGALQKVVLSRQLTLESDVEFSIGDIVRRLRTDQPNCYVFAAGGFVGASPELLVERKGRVVRSRPMAGTTDRSGGRAMAWLAGSAKNRQEHSLVVEAVVTGLQRLCSEPLQVSQPYAEEFADLAHIVTDVAGTLTSEPASALEVALALHPTPAVAGTPTDSALTLIGALEPRSRGRYGGPVGWVDGAGDGEFAVALRCADLQGKRAVLYAGAGIVTGSTAGDEWQETETKLGAMQRALARR